MPTRLPGQPGRHPRPAGPAAHPPKGGTLETQRLPAGARRKFRIMIEFDIRPTDHPVPDAEREEKLQSPGFGQLFTDHMITLRWTAERGWHDGRLEAYGPFTLDPATSVFHYSQEFFEGLKAYRQDNGSITMFRPDANAARFNSTARRMAMPELPPETFIRALELLVAQDREWVPGGEGNSLYLRPFMIATQRGLGVNHPSSEYLFCVIASPAASYFASRVNPVTVWLSQEYTRAAPGGTGGVKTGGNYARSEERRVAKEGRPRLAVAKREELCCVSACVVSG